MTGAEATNKIYGEADPTADAAELDKTLVKAKQEAAAVARRLAEIEAREDEVKTATSALELKSNDNIAAGDRLRQRALDMDERDAVLEVAALGNGHFTP